MIDTIRVVAAPALALALFAAPAAAQDSTGKGDGGMGGGGLSAPSMPAASGDMMVKIGTADVTPILDSNGIAYEVSTDDYGDPIILVDNPPAGERMAVFYYDCSPAGCEDIGLYAYFTTNNPDMNAVNAYNKGLRWGRAYLDDDNDPVFELDINATGGIGREALQILVQTYLNGMQDFASEMGAN